MRLRLYEDAVRAKSRQTSKSGSEVDAPSDSEEEPTSGPAQEASAPAAEAQPANEPPTPSEAGIGQGKGAGSKTRSQKGLVLSQAVAMAEAESTPYAVKLRTEMVHRVLEGLRDEALELARDIGIESLTGPGGLDDFINRMREVVFPRATEEARELFRAGQRQGTLHRLSYVSRRRRWWKLLKTLDSSIELSEPTRVELLLELSGLTRQESLAIKACAQDIKSFESVARTTLVYTCVRAVLLESEPRAAQPGPLGAGARVPLRDPQARVVARDLLVELIPLLRRLKSMTRRSTWRRIPIHTILRPTRLWEAMMMTMIPNRILMRTWMRSMRTTS